MYKKALMVFLLMPLLFSCNTYKKSMSTYCNSILSGDFANAFRELDKNKYLGKKRNELLYLFEQGRLNHLAGNYEKSNYFFNAADDFIDEDSKKALDLAVGNLVNPAMENYHGEEFEKFMINFYKGINYIELNKHQDALVEARKITLANDCLSEKYKENTSRYNKDAFALNLQGMLYEMAGEINNAFISYRNATDIYLKSGNSYYGVLIPEQLKKDLLRTADLMGFEDERIHYENLFNLKFDKNKIAERELVLFIEQGMAPVKEEAGFTLISTNSSGVFVYNDPSGGVITFPFDFRRYGISDIKLKKIKSFRVALPAYRATSLPESALRISSGNNDYQAETAQDFNDLAVSVLRERFFSELTKAATRYLVKKLVEKGSEKAAENIASQILQKKENPNATEEEKERERKANEQKAQTIGAVVGLMVNVSNTVTEKADTRSWLGLPASISYVRIPLSAGEQTITVSNSRRIKQLNISGENGVQIRSVFMN